MAAAPADLPRRVCGISPRSQLPGDDGLAGDLLLVRVWWPPRTPGRVDPEATPIHAAGAPNSGCGNDEPRAHACVVSSFCVTHLRRSPVHHYAEHRSYSWYVDIDRLPGCRAGCACSPGSRPSTTDWRPDDDTLRQRVRRVPARHDIRLPGGQVTASADATRAGPRLQPAEPVLVPRRDRCVALRDRRGAEPRRRSVRLPAAAGRGPAGSGDQPVLHLAVQRGRGYYLVRAPRLAEALDVTMSLHRENQPALVATWRVRAGAPPPGRSLRLQFTTPLARRWRH